MLITPALPITLVIKKGMLLLVASFCHLRDGNIVILE